MSYKRQLEGFAKPKCRFSVAYYRKNSNPINFHLFQALKSHFEEQ